MSVGYPSVVDLSWRVDVSLSTSRTNRVLRPYVLLRIETDAGKPPLIFEVPRDRFDELRYAVSASESTSPSFSSAALRLALQRPLLPYLPH